MDQTDKLYRPEEEDIQSLSRIRDNYATLTKSQKKIARYVLDNQKQVMDLSITQLAQKTSTSITAVTRFCQALQYTGFSEFKFYLRKDTLPTAVAAEPIGEEDPFSVVSQKLELAARNALAETYRILDERTVCAVAQAVAKAGKVHIYAMGGAGDTAEVAARLLMQAGVLSSVFSETTAMITAPLWLDHQDVAVGISYSGNSVPVLDALHTARERGAVTVGISGTPNSMLSKEVHHFLGYCYGIPDDLRYLHIARICEIAVIGRLQSQIMASGSTQHLMPQIKDAILYSRKK